MGHAYHVRKDDADSSAQIGEGEERGSDDAALDEYTRRATAGTRRIQASALHQPNRSPLDDDDVWGKAPWDEVEDDGKAPDNWTPKGVATLDASELLQAVKNERNPSARKKLVDEMLRRDLGSEKLAPIPPRQVVDVIANEPDGITRAKLAEQLREREMTDEEREESALELLLMPDGNLKLTAMEMLVLDPQQAVYQLEDRLSRENQPEKLEVLQSALEFLRKRAANEEEN